MRGVRLAGLAIWLLPLLGQEQTPPKKKKGFLERMNEKLEKLNQTVDPNAGATPQPPPKAPRAREEQQSPAAVARPGYDRKGTCTAFGWTKPTTQDPAQVLPPGSSTQYHRNYPEPVKPVATYTLEQLGRTQTIRAVFPPRKYKTMLRVGRENVIIAPRDASQPFEAELTLKDGKLFSASCDENGVYHDSGGDTFITDNRKIVYIDNEEAQKRGGGLMGGDPMSPFVCTGCYFLDKVFYDSMEDDRFVVMVHPELGTVPQYYVFRIKPWPKYIVARPIPNLCQLDNDNSGCGPGILERFEYTEDAADEAMFPGARANYWFVRCNAQRCEQRTFDRIAAK